MVESQENPAGEHAENETSEVNELPSEKRNIPAAGGPHDSDPPELLRRAQAAFEQGKQLDARQLALQAAQGISKMEAEKAQRRLHDLQVDWKNAVQASEEAEGLLARLKDDFQTNEISLKQAQSAVTKTTSTFEQRNAAHLEVKRELEEVEKRLNEIQYRYREILARLEETQPATDAAQRERRRAQTELERAELAHRNVRQRKDEAEEAADKAQDRKASLERELKELRKKIEGGQ